MTHRLHFVAMFLAVATPVFAADVVYTPLVSLGNDVECEKCEGWLLPGEVVPRDDWRYAIHSDLPEIFLTPGVLYTTAPVLPPFDTKKDGPLAEEMRRQINHGFTGVDGSFEIFLYHMSEPRAGKAPRRIVVLARNQGSETTTVTPRSVIAASDAMATQDGPEMVLARRVFTGEMDAGVAVTIEPGAAAVIANTPILSAAASDGDDVRASAFVNGIVRGELSGTETPNLEIAVVAIPGETPKAEWTTTATGLLGQGAQSGEGSMDLRIPPPDCHLRRVVGVYRNFMWKGAATLDVNKLPGDNVAFQMALPAAQAKGCEQARQTQDMLLHPPYVRPETIGNYTIEYEVTLELHNPGTEPAAVDVRFGKQDAMVGLVWTAAVGPLDGSAEKGPMRSGWAGGNAIDDRPDNTRTFLGEAPLLIPAGEARRVDLHFHIVGTSSLPFQLHVVRDR